MVERANLYRTCQIIPDRTCVSAPGRFGAERVSRCMTGGTIAERLRQIGSPIPFGALGRIGAEASALEEQNLPTFLQSNAEFLRVVGAGIADGRIRYLEGHCRLSGERA